MALSKKRLKQLLSECHWPTDNKLWNIVKDQSSNYFFARAKEAIQTAEDTSEPEEAERQLILAIRMLNMARHNHIQTITTSLPSLPERISNFIDNREVDVPTN